MVLGESEKVPMASPISTVDQRLPDVVACLRRPRLVEAMRSASQIEHRFVLPIKYWIDFPSHTFWCSRSNFGFPINWPAP